MFSSFTLIEKRAYRSHVQSQYNYKGYLLNLALFHRKEKRKKKLLRNALNLYTVTITQLCTQLHSNINYDDP